MSLNKKTMIREIGRRTRLKNREVQAVIETLIDVWTEELVRGGRIEVENFVSLFVQLSHRRNPKTQTRDTVTSVRIRVGSQLRRLLNEVLN